ncbi:MAG: hypothetical protein ABFC24_05525 [Methanoregulaceae archaeon]
MPRNLIPILLISLVFLLSPAVSASEIPVQWGTGPDGTFVTFIAEDTTFRSPQVHDIIGDPAGEVLFATSGGLAFYNGSWTIWHPDLSIVNTSRTLLQDTILSLEYDSVGRLWIGYGNGIQIWNGQYFTTVDDAQLLKDRQILSLQRWNDTMWIGTGHSGIHRYSDSTGWTWYQPFEEGGANFYQVDSIAQDPASNTLFLVTHGNGPWQIRGDPSGTVEFVSLTTPSQTYHSLSQVKQDPLGGVYFSDTNRVVHYQTDTGFIPVLSAENLSKPLVPEIEDVETLPDAVLVIATDRGIYFWQDGGVIDHIYGFAAAGAGSDDIDTLFLDSSGRLWFAGQGVIGYYQSDRTKLPTISVESPEPTITWQVQTLDQGSEEASPTVTYGTYATRAEPAISSENQNPVLVSIGTFFENIGIWFGNLLSPNHGTA